MNDGIGEVLRLCSFVVTSNITLCGVLVCPGKQQQEGCTCFRLVHNSLFVPAPRKTPHASFSLCGLMSGATLWWKAHTHIASLLYVHRVVSTLHRRACVYLDAVGDVR